jgi:hypothetical protein
MVAWAWALDSPRLCLPRHAGGVEGDARGSRRSDIADRTWTGPASDARATIPMTTDLVRTAARPIVIDRTVYGTITLCAVLIVYDGWATLKLLDVVVIIVGPVLAMSIGHAFASALARQAELGRSLTNAERLEAVRLASWFMLLAIVPAVLVVLIRLAGASLDTAVRVVIWLGAGSLGFWGGLAAYQAGLRGRRVVLGVVAGLVVGGTVLVLQVLLQPGKAVTNGVAAKSQPYKPMASAASQLAMCTVAEVRREASVSPTIPDRAAAPIVTTSTTSGLRFRVAFLSHVGADGVVGVYCRARWTRSSAS